MQSFDTAMRTFSTVLTHILKILGSNYLPPTRKYENKIYNLTWNFMSCRLYLSFIVMMAIWLNMFLRLGSLDGEIYANTYVLTVYFQMSSFFCQNSTFSKTPNKTSAFSIHGEPCTVCCFKKQTLVFVAKVSLSRPHAQGYWDFLGTFLARLSTWNKYGVFKVGFEYSSGCFLKLECTPSRKEECRRTKYYILGEGNVPLKNILALCSSLQRSRFLPTKLAGVSFRWYSVYRH